MNLMQDNLKPARWRKPIDDQAVRSLSHFEIRPIFDGGGHVVTTGVINDDKYSNAIQIRMGVIGKPTEQIALYNICDTRLAFIDFYKLRKFDKPLFYDGIEIGCELNSPEDFIRFLLDSEWINDTPSDVEKPCALVGMMPKSPSENL